MANFFLKRFTNQTQKDIKGFTGEAMTRLISYSWPGNIRELENVIERAAVLTSQGESIRQDALFPDSFAMSSREDSVAKSLKQAVGLFKKNFITSALETNGWHQTKTARLLGIQRTYLSRLIKELNIIKD